MLYCNSIYQLPPLQWCDAFHHPGLSPHIRLSAHPLSLHTFSLRWKLPTPAAAVFNLWSSNDVFWYQGCKKNNCTELQIHLFQATLTIYLQCKFIANQVTRASVSATYHALQVPSDKHLTSAVFWNWRHFSTATEVRLCYGWLDPKVLFLQVGTDDLRTVNIKELSKQQSQRDISVMLPKLVLPTQKSPPFKI